MWARAEASRAASVFRFAAEEVRRSGGEHAAPRHRRGTSGGPRRDRPPLPDTARCWASRRSTSRSTSWRTRSRRRSPSVRPSSLKPAPRDAAVGAAARRAARRDRPARRLVVGAARRQRRGARARRRRAPADRVLHRLGDGRLRDPEGACRTSTSRSSSAATPPRSSAPTGRPTPTSTGPRRASRPSPTTRPASPASRCSACSSTPRCGTASCRRSSPRSRRSRPASPWDEATVVGPLVDEKRRDPRRRPGWTRPSPRARRCSPAAVRDGASYAPTVLDRRARRRQGVVRGGLRPGARRCSAWTGVDEAFADRQRQPLRAADRRVHPRPAGGVPCAPRARGGRRVVGDVPSYRADQMPYGGVKASGVGREGLRYAMEDFTYERVLVLTGLTL